MINKKQNKGFTIMELMIVVAIIGILASIAYPSYMDYIRDTNRKAAVARLNEFAQALERSYTVNNGNYWGGVNKPKPTKAYEFDICREAERYQIFAKPLSGKMYDKDCKVLVMNSYGEQGTQDSLNGCWKDIKPNKQCFR